MTSQRSIAFHALLLIFLLHRSGSAQVVPNTVFSGSATAYPYEGDGAYSIPAAELPAYTVAMNADQDGNSAWGGAWVEVTGPEGTVQAMVVDLCPGCGSGNLDMDEEAYFQIASEYGIVPIAWKWITAPGEIGPIHFYSEGSNPYYLKLQAANIQNPAEKMEVFFEGSYVDMPRSADNHFIFSGGGPLPDPFTIRVTDIFGNEVVSAGLTLAGTAEGQNGSGNFPKITTGEIVIEQPLGTPVFDGEARDFGISVDASLKAVEFTVRNEGSSLLTGLALTIDGADAVDFSVRTAPAPSLAPGGTTNFSIGFSSAATGERGAVLHLASSASDPSLASYEVVLSGRAFSSSMDSDLDGLNDAAEAAMAPLGFDWQEAQPALVANYYDHANLAGLYDESQVKALHVDVPLIQRQSSGSFVLRLGLRKSDDLSIFAPFPFSASGISINGAGQLEYEFTSPDDAAFYRLETD
ncbi:expansin EXLX1 family cellulose-binding protein [Haloferula sargassicola]|uniref:Choice-of-anchor D domain-containing protein n=1 Tax=Haloferula sargassicola TaxID=490096 RepID=A0ABP9UJD2_9BACT